MVVEVVYLDSTGSPIRSSVTDLSNVYSVAKCNCLVFPLGIDMIAPWDFRSDDSRTARADRKSDKDYCRFMETAAGMFKKLRNKYGQCELIGTLSGHKWRLHTS